MLFLLSAESNPFVLHFFNSVPAMCHVRFNFEHRYWTCGRQRNSLLPRLCRQSLPGEPNCTERPLCALNSRSQFDPERRLSRFSPNDLNYSLMPTFPARIQQARCGQKPTFDLNYRCDDDASSAGSICPNSSRKPLHPHVHKMSSEKRFPKRANTLLVFTALLNRF